MNVKVEYTVDVTDKARLAIARINGDPGLADRTGVKAFFTDFGEHVGRGMIAEEILVIEREADEMAATLGVST